MKKLGITTLALAGAAASIAWAATPAETIGARQDNFKQIGRSFKAVRDELGKPAPSVDVLRANARTLKQAAARVGSLFPRGTGPEAGVRTAALAAIWQREADFQAAAGRLVSAANSLDTAASGGNLDAIRAAVGPVGGSCKNCHDSFKARD